MKKYMISGLITCLIGCGLAGSAQVSAQFNDDIVFLISEEQLARDIYTLANARYSQHVFEHKIAAEDNHRNMLLSISRDTIHRTAEYGVFTDPQWQNTFNELKAKVSISLTEALKAGAFIEESDIADLELRKARTTDSIALDAYTTLIAASEQHLRSFLDQLAVQNTTYTPVRLTAERIKEIQSTAAACGAPGQQKTGSCCKQGGS